MKVIKHFFSKLSIIEDNNDHMIVQETASSGALRYIIDRKQILLFLILIAIGAKLLSTKAESAEPSHATTNFNSVINSNVPYQAPRHIPRAVQR